MIGLLMLRRQHGIEVKSDFSGVWPLGLTLATQFTGNVTLGNFINFSGLVFLSVQWA